MLLSHLPLWQLKSWYVTLDRKMYAKKGKEKNMFRNAVILHVNKLLLHFLYIQIVGYLPFFCRMIFLTRFIIVTTQTVACS